MAAVVLPPSHANPRRTGSPLAAGHSSRGLGGVSGIDDKFHIAVEEVEEADQLAETFVAQAASRASLLGETGLPLRRAVSEVIALWPV